MHVFGADSDLDQIRRAIDAGEPFWLDVPADRFDADHPAARAVGVDVARLDRLKERRGRPLAIVEDESAAIVFSGAVLAEDVVEAVEVTVLAGRAVLVTLRDKPCPPLDELRYSPHDVDAVRVLDALTDSLLSVAEDLDGAVDTAQNDVLQRRSGQVLAAVAALRQRLSDLLGIARAQRGMVVRSRDELEGLPVTFGAAERRVRDLEGNVERAVDLAESTRQTIAETLDLYLTTAAESLTRIATLLLPLTVVTGFFGMNFGWMVGHIDTLWSFLVFGVGGLVMAVAVVQFYLRRKGYG